MRDIIVFGEDWGSHPSSTQHLLLRLLSDHRVIWVNSIGLRRPRLSLHDFKRMWRKLAAMRSPTPPPRPDDSPKPIIVAPRAIPWPGNRLASWLNRKLLGQQLRNIMKKHSINHPILWISLPTAVDVVGELNEAAVIYYCGDDFNALVGVDHAAVDRLERTLEKCADLILVASERLANKFAPEKTRVLPHGADIAKFQTTVERANDLPAGKPIAGFYGSISDWLDQKLIAECARKLPTWNFVFIGPIRTDVAELKSYNNIIFLGERQHHELAAYSQYWDVSLLPFLDTEQIRACNPLKLREYLAAGTPIVSTDFPALNGYRDLLLVAKDSDAFVAALLSALTEKRSRASERQQRVAGETWEARADKIRQWLKRWE